jgi:PAS domain S-box-containing protein
MGEHDKVNILMVDDQPAKLLSYEVILSDLGENLIKAGSGREALEHLLKTDVAVVLMDVSMPEIDGFELAEIIHQHPRYQKTAIIFISAVHLTDLDRLKGYERGAVDYISVPVVPEVLRAKVSVFAELYRKTQQLERLNRELEARVAERTAELEASTARLRASEELFRAIFENAGIGISVLNQNARLLQVNPTMEEMFGYSEGEMRDMEVTALTHPDDVKSDMDAFQEVGAGRLDRYQVEKRYYRNGGQLLWGRFTGTSIKDAAGQPQGVIGMLEDITERKQAEDTLRQANEELSQFAYIVSHDLQEPLRTVRLYAQLLARRYGAQWDGEARAFVDQVVTGTGRMSALLQDLLAYLHAGAESEAACVPVDCEAVVARALTHLRTAIDASGAIITQDPLPKVLWQEAPLLHLFQNLLSNALKYRREVPPRVHIAARRLPGAWLFSVQDNGIGIEPQYVEQIFRVFKRLHGSTFPGTGIGLAICQKIVERAGGRIWVESVPGQGATFCFTIPDQGGFTHG